MSRIKILPEILSNKIAAGEVVERPASVVKELVENALDAGSTRITVEVRQGGKSLIRVSDNGSGMGHDDALLALERYATSKIYRDSDLFDIRTLGFRGEALPSIAAVSRFALVTRQKDAESGTEIIVEGGKIKRVSDTGAPAGTMVTVKQLFFNTPARRKFLKTVNTEMGHVADTLCGIAMAWPDVQFRLVHNERAVKNWSAAPDPADRVADVLGGDVRPYLFPLVFDSPHVSVSGWLASPGIHRGTTRGIYIYVNGRFVRDRVIRHALVSGYSGRLMKGRFPVAVLFIRVPFDRVDVNVHPTKHEVRFAEQKTVHDAVAGIVSETLRNEDRTPWAGAKGKGHGAWRKGGGLPRRSLGEGGRTEAEQWVYNKGTGQPAVAEMSPAYPEGNGSMLNSPTTPVSTRNLQPGTQQTFWRKSRLADARIIGQYHGTYIICETEEGLVLVDQHAAHERVIFEQLKNRSAREKAGVQKLLMPETIELGYREADALDKLIAELNELGFEIEPFGGNTFVVKAVPAILSGRDVRPLIVEIVENAVSIGFGTGMEKVLDRCLMLMACHGAIRANESLPDIRIRQLLKDLDRCDTPSHCPHGRPTWIRWTVKELEKAFHRIV